MGEEDTNTPTTPVTSTTDVPSSINNKTHSTNSNDDNGNNDDNVNTTAENENNSSSSLADSKLNISDIRHSANHYFSQGDYDAALPMYELAVDLCRQRRDKKDEENKNDNDDGDGEKETNDEEFCIHLCNKAACLFKMDRFEEARVAAEEAIKVSHGKNPKAYFRLARCQLSLYQYSPALSTISTALSTLPPSTHPEFLKLQTHAKKLLLKGTPPPPPFDISQTISIATEPRKPSIKEFTLSSDLGEGNFSKIVVATHKHTGEEFALKIIEKKKAAQLAKRQHPNVYNEIEMERRVLSDRLPRHPRIVTLYHAMSDYNSLYFLMDHVTGGDLWSRLRAFDKMVGCHPSLIRRYAHEVLEGVEHMHAHGIVHRDLKPENILIDDAGRCVIIDFNTAKDLIQTDLNGPEFVGTPDFMSPEAVKGKGDGGAGRESDLWSWAAVVYQMYVGSTPFAALSPYLTFLRIRRGVCYRSEVVEDEAWDLIQRVLKVDPKERLGSGCFEEGGEGSYECIKSHAFFERGEVEGAPIPSLQDLAALSLVEMIRKDAHNLDVSDPGSGGSQDLLRLPLRHRRRVMHVLDKMNALCDPPRVYRRFFKTKQEAKLNKVGLWSHDFLGLKKDLTPGKKMEEGEVPEGMSFVFFVHPLFVRGREYEEGKKKELLEGLKDRIRKINRCRPKMVIAAGQFDTTTKKLLGKINESIPVILADGSNFFEIWQNGGQGLILNTRALLFNPDTDDGDEELKQLAQEQKSFINMNLEASRLSEQPVFLFFDDDVRQIPPPMINKFARAKIDAVLGIVPSNDGDTYEKVVTMEKGSAIDESDRDSDSDEDKCDETHKITVCGGEDVLWSVSVDEEGMWKKSDL